MARNNNGVADPAENTRKTVTMIVIPQSEWNNLKQQLDDISTFVAEQKKEKDDDVWYTIDETMKILKVSKKTLQIYRDRHYIAFHQFGKKIKFKKADIEAFLGGNIVEADDFDSGRM